MEKNKIIEDAVAEFEKLSKKHLGMSSERREEIDWLRTTLTSLVKNAQEEERANTISIVEDIKDFVGGTDSEVDTYIDEILSSLSTPQL